MTYPDLSIALYCPDIALNVGAAIRLCACLGTPLHVIEPCGFPWNEQKIKKSALDYRDSLDVSRHTNWNDFIEKTSGQRLILMTTKAKTSLYDFNFRPGDILLAGSESSGAPKHVHDYVDARLTIPMHGDARSLNIVNATSIFAGEAVRQIRHKN